MQDDVQDDMQDENQDLAAAKKKLMQSHNNHLGSFRGSLEEGIAIIISMNQNGKHK